MVSEGGDRRSAMMSERGDKRSVVSEGMGGGGVQC